MHGGGKECITVLVGRSEGRRTLGRSDIKKLILKKSGRG